MVEQAPFSRTIKASRSGLAYKLLSSAFTIRCNDQNKLIGRDVTTSSLPFMGGMSLHHSLGQTYRFRWLCPVHSLMLRHDLEARQSLCWQRLTFLYNKQLLPSPRRTLRLKSFIAEQAKFQGDLTSRRFGILPAICSFNFPIYVPSIGSGQY